MPRRDVRRCPTLAVVVGLLALWSAGCGSGGESQSARPRVTRDLSLIVPWRAVTLTTPLDPAWSDYDDRPQSAAREAIDDTLDQLKAIGARQVEIPAVFAWSVEDERSTSMAAQSIVYFDPSYRPDDPATWGALRRTRRGDMGLVAYQPLTSWDSPVPLQTPLEINQKAEQTLGRLLNTVARMGLIPILRLEFRVVGAKNALGVGVIAPDTDPSRNLDQFYLKYKEHVVAMARLAARHDAAMVILGVGTPNVAGAGQSRFADGSSMAERRELIREKWRDMVRAARLVAAQEGRPDLVFAYVERNVWREPTGPSGSKTPVWQRVPFWDDLDAIGIGICLTEGFETNGQLTPPTVEELVVRSEKQGFVTDGIPNILDIRNFFRFRRGYNRNTKPVFLDEIECGGPPKVGSQSVASASASPPNRQNLTGRQRFYQAHMELARRYGTDWLAGLGFSQRAVASSGPAPGTPPSPPREIADDSTGFLRTAAEAHVRDYFVGTVARFGELVVNPGFELGNAAPWSLQEWGGRTELRLNGERVHAGRWALQITNPKAGSEGAAVSLRIPVSAGVKYRASAWLYLEDMSGGGAQVTVKWYGPRDQVISTSRSSSRTRATPSWAQESLDLTAPDDAVYAKVILYAYDVGTVHFDDVSFRRFE